MSIRIPLAKNRSGDVSSPLPFLVVRVQGETGEWLHLPFKVDTGADVAAIPVSIARSRGIPYEETRPGWAGGMVGRTKKYRDTILIRIGDREHLWVCDFIMEPPASQGSSGPVPFSVLGRAGLLDEYAISLDSGYLILTHLGPIRRFWRRLRERIWKMFGLTHDLRKPI